MPNAVDTRAATFLAAMNDVKANRQGKGYTGASPEYIDAVSALVRDLLAEVHRLREAMEQANEQPRAVR